MAERLTRYAKLDPATGRADLFRPARRGEKRFGAGVKTTIEENGGADQGGATLEFKTPERLGANDQSVFLAICALAGIAADNEIIVGGTVSQDSDDDVLMQIRPNGKYSDREEPVRFWTSHYRILREAGLNARGKTVYDELRLIFDRLGSITTTEHRREGNKRIQTNQDRLLVYQIDDAGDASITISPRLARAVIGIEAQYAKVWLTERRALKSDLAKILHARFSVILDPGEYWHFNMDALIERYYGQAKTKKTMHNRRSTLRNAVSEINDLTSWSIDEEAGRYGPQIIVGRGTQRKRPRDRKQQGKFELC